MKRHASGARFLAHWVLTAFAMLATVVQAAPSRWTLVPIPPLASQGSDISLDINNRGEVVGYGTVNAGQGFALHGFLWDNGTMIDIGVPPGSAPTTMTMAYSINDRGTVIASDAGGNGYLWRDGAWSLLQLPGFPRYINKSETMAGTYTTSSGWGHGFIYRDGVFTDIGTVGGPYSEVAALNDRGAVVGKSLAANFEYHPFVYEDGAMKDLGTFGGRFGVATGINNHGVVVGSAYDAANEIHAFVHDGAGIRRLFPGRPGMSQAFGINDRGAIIGSFGPIDTAFVYDNGVLTMLDQIAEVRAAGWSWLVPTGINDRGWITGYGRQGASYSSVAFVLIPK